MQQGSEAMRFTLILEDEFGNQLDMTQTANQYMTSEIDGLYPPAGTVSTSAYAGMNGSYLNNAFIEKRNLVISFAMRGIKIEQNRHALYKIVKPSRYVKVYYRTKNIDVYTEGYVESCNITNFTNETIGQISILCPDIYWYSINSTYAYFARISDAFHFPFPESDAPFPLGTYNHSNIISLQNDGDEIGFTLVLENVGKENVVNPTIYNVDSGAYLQIKTVMLPGDVITVTTKIGNKTVTLTRNGVNSNLINSFVAGSTWLTLPTGKTRLRISAALNLNALKVTAIHTNAYLGV